MAELELLTYYKKMCEQNIVFDFQGAMSQDMLVGMAELIKNKFSREFSRPNVVKKIFAVFIEMAQNIAHYSTERVRLDNQCTDVGGGIIQVTEENNIYTVTSGNLVKKEAIPRVLKHCEKINRMDKEGLKQFYKEQIKSSSRRGKGGAGIGLIDIARKSGHAIQYKATPVGDHNAFLELSVTIEENNENG